MPQPSVKPESMEFRDIIDEIDGGVMKIPEFQRDFDWNLERTLSLLDSIGKRYPVGAFLLWETDDVLGVLRNIGNLDLPPVPTGKDVTYVLDGQQRITSLYAAAKGATINGESYVVFADLDANPDTQQIFATEGPRNKNNRRYVRLDDLIGDKAHNITPDLSLRRRRRFDEIRDAFRNYHFPVIRVRHQSINAVCEMFERVNTGGMTLDLFDIMVAKTWTPDFNLRDRWEELVAELNGCGFEGIASRLMLQALGAQLRGDITEKTILRIGRDEIIPAWDHARECLKHSIDFLRQSARVPGLRLLSYPSIILALMHVHHLSGLKRPDAAQTDRILEYIARVGLTQRYGSNPSSTLPEDLKLMQSIARRQKGETPVHPILPREIQELPLRTGSALCRAVLALLAQARPRNLVNGEEVALDNSYLAQSNSRHYHHIFPRDWLRKNGYDDWNSMNCIANIMLVPRDQNLQTGKKAPSKYVAAFKKKAGAKWRGWLKSHAIDAYAERALLADDFERFVECRSKCIAGMANEAMGLSRDDVKMMTE
ncbi:MAG TPA: hypothetical protein DGT21_02155 [Armatimonadetes bacterium]|nr:hypothetical protein [Armatimonadota bacterium]